MRAVLDGVVIAESDETVVVEGNHYFPIGSLNQELIRQAERTTVCGWKGTANYYDVVTPDATASNGAWYYPEPKDAAAQIKDHVAFGRPIVVES
ncbi:MAG: DUF427 domain-containing protein [Actinomycetota bacterium]